MIDRLTLGLLIGLMGLSACARVTPEVVNTPAPSPTVSGVVNNSKPLEVTVSIVPQEYFVKKIGGDRVAVNVMIRPGMDPHTYEPKPEDLKKLADSRAYFKIGVSLEDAWNDRIKSVNPALPMVDTSKGVDKIPMTEEEHDHDHGQHDHAHGSLDPHIWLSPKRVKVQAENIYNTLVKLDPTNKEVYKANFERFQEELNQLDRDLAKNLAGVKNKKFLVFHPEWGYFAKDYGLEMLSIQVEGNEPSASELAALIDRAKRDNIKVIFAQPEFSTKSADTIAREIGGKVITISAFSPDWSENLRRVSLEMARVLNKE